MPLPSRLPKAVLAVFLGATALAAVSAALHPDRRLPTYAGTRAAVEAECRVYRSDPRHRDAGVCRTAKDGKPLAVVPLFQKAKADLALVSARVAAGDKDGARLTMMQVLRDADRAERHGRFLDRLVASRLFDAALDVMDAHADVFDGPFVADAFSNVTPDSGARAIRVDTMDVVQSGLSGIDGVRPAFRPLLARVVPLALAELVERRSAMETAIRAGDVAGCKKASKRTWPAIGTVSEGYDEMLCDRAAELSKTVDRVARVRASAGLPHARAARQR